MRRFLGGGLAAFILATMGVAVATPAHADTSNLDYTVTSDTGVYRNWWMDCNRLTGYRYTATVFMVATETGSYTFRDQMTTGLFTDGRLSVWAGPYDEADAANCVGEVDDVGAISLEAGVVYTVVGGGFGGLRGDFRYLVDGPGALVVAPFATAVTAAASTGAPVAGTPFSLTAQVTSAVAGSDLTGTMIFFADGTALATVPVDAAGSAELPGVALGAGDHEVTAEYSPGTSLQAPSTSAPLVLTVAPAAVEPEPEPEPTDAEPTLAAAGPADVVPLLGLAAMLLLSGAALLGGRVLAARRS